MMLGQDAAQQWNSLSASRLLGINMANGSRAAGASLPPTTAAYGDKGAVWWSPDSPTFWLVGVAAATIVGLAGVEVRGRAGPFKAGASAGTA
jgi:hypothetical protein